MFVGNIRLIANRHVATAITAPGASQCTRNIGVAYILLQDRNRCVAEIGDNLIVTTWNLPVTSERNQSVSPTQTESHVPQHRLRQDYKSVPFAHHPVTENFYHTPSGRTERTPNMENDYDEEKFHPRCFGCRCLYVQCSPAWRHLDALIARDGTGQARQV